VRRALALPPGEAVRKARRLARMRASELRQRVLDAATGDPLVGPAAERAAHRGGGLAWDADPGQLFRGDAVLPLLWPAAPPHLPAQTIERIRFAAARAIEHRFDLLGSGPVRVDYALAAAGVEGGVYRMAPGQAAAAAQLARMERLLPASVPAAYAPIDWHLDFKSGWRWPADAWYRRVRYGVARGVDIKVPWELSRLQHAGALGLAWRYAPASPEGGAAPAEFRAQVVDWLAANPLRRGVNWACTMDVALRALSWLSGVALLEGAPELTPDFRLLLARALRLHALHIESNLEYDADRTGNHYLSNVLGLVALGAALPQAPEAERWLAFGLQEIVSEARRQILPDGADIEGSSAYHAFVLEMLLCAAAIAARLPASRRERLGAHWPAGAGDRRRGGAPPLAPLARQALDLTSDAIFPADVHERFLAAAALAAELTGEDGLLPQVGDHDSGRALALVPDLVTDGASEWVPEPRDWRQVLALAGALYDEPSLARLGAPYALNGALLAPRPIAAREDAGARGGGMRSTGAEGSLALYPQGGLAVARAGALRLLASFGRVARQSAGAHQHNDLLAFELSYAGERLVVDGGSYLYTAVPELRDAFRRTAAHSTVAVAGREQRRWPPASVSLFMVTGDAEVTTYAAEPGRLQLECRYPGVTHRREWRWTQTRLEVADRVQADAPASLVLNLAPGVRVEQAGQRADGCLLLELHAGTVCAAVTLEGVTSVELAEGVYSIGYGRRLSNVAIVAALAGASCRTVIELACAGRGGGE
ncbi:MAG TPA: alginate lyase family protein, partial [Longimicrobiales bacterium]